MNNRKTILLPDGYNGHKARFFVNPLEVDGDLVKLQCAEPEKEYMFTWRKFKDIQEAIIFTIQ